MLCYDTEDQSVRLNCFADKFTNMQVKKHKAKSKKRKREKSGTSDRSAGKAVACKRGSACC